MTHRPRGQDFRSGDCAGQSRRDFIRSLAGLGFVTAAGYGGSSPHRAHDSRATVFRVDNCPVHDGRLRHLGLDLMLGLLAEHGTALYRSGASHPWASENGIIDVHDVVLVKVNCQWKCRGTTNTDLVRGLIHRILEHPDGFSGEVVIIENGQGRGGFDGVISADAGWYSAWPEVVTSVHVNAEDESVLTVDYLVNEVFRGQPVSSYLLDSIRDRFIAADNHVAEGYRRISPPVGSSPSTPVSYPCFTTGGGRRVELREGVWTGSSYASNLKLINVPVLKHHDGCGMTGALKHVYGLLSMSDGYVQRRHYSQIGAQCGAMSTVVRASDLNILDCIWVSHSSLVGYPPSTTHRSNILLAGLDPLAIDYHASKHILLPLGGSMAGQHDPDRSAGLLAMLEGARDFINANGGIKGTPVVLGDASADVVARNAVDTRPPRRHLRGM